MAESIDQMIIRMGFDAEQVKRGMEDMMSKQRTAARDYVGFWEGAIAKKEAAEIASINRVSEAYKRATSNISSQINSSKVSSVPLSVMAAQRAREAAEIAAGSGGFGWTEKAGVAASGAMLGKSAMGMIGGSRTAMLEIGHSVRAVIDMLLAGMSPLKAAAMEAPRIIQALNAAGISMKALGAAALRFGGAFAAASMGAMNIYELGKEGMQWHSAENQIASSNVDAKQQALAMAVKLREMASGMNQRGLLSSDENASIASLLGGNITNEKVRQVQKLLLSKNDKVGETEMDTDKLNVESNKVKSEIDAMHDKQRSIVDLKSEENDLTKKNQELNSKITELSNANLGNRENAVETANRENAIAKMNLEIANNSLTLEKDKTDQKRKQNETDSMSLELHRLKSEKAKLFTDAASVDKNSPTIEQMAGRGYMGRLSAMFGEGGSMDLGSGNGAYSIAAQDALYWKNKQTYDLEQGNGGWKKRADGSYGLTGAAAFDRQMQMNAENKLGAAGLDTPMMKFEKMREHLSEIEKSISNLNERATGAGINIADNI